MKSVTAIVPYFGAKRVLAQRIIEALGPHRAYWEPFCGSMAVLLAKPQCAMETVNDLNGDLINLARVIQCTTLGAALYRRLRRTLMCEGLFADSIARFEAGDCGAQPDVGRAFDYFVVSWMGRNGVAGTHISNHCFCVRYTKNGGHAARRFQSAVLSIPAFRRRLRNVTILRRDAFAPLDKIEDAQGTVIYVDPPYLKKGAKYLHDFESDDHDRLAKALRRFTKTRVVVSYYADERLSDLYDGWDYLDVPTTKGMASQAQRDAGHRVVAPEVLLINQGGMLL